MSAFAVSQGTPRPRRGWLRYSLRTLLVLVTGLCIALALWVVPAERQRRAVAAIRTGQGFVRYDFEVSKTAAPSPEWLSKLVGVDYLARPRLVWLPETTTDADLVFVSGMTGLENLHLPDARVGDAGVAHLSALTNLKTLQLEGTQVGSEGISRLVDLTSLQRLFLAGTQVDDAALAYLSGCTHMEYLHLNRTHVTDSGLAHLNGMTKLKHLHLEGTNVSDAGLEHLRGLTALQNLGLVDTRVTVAGVEKLQKALPGCRMVW